MLGIESINEAFVDWMQNVQIYLACLFPVTGENLPQKRLPLITKNVSSLNFCDLLRILLPVNPVLAGMPVNTEILTEYFSHDRFN
jgi:hypothetical protein